MFHSRSQAPAWERTASEAPASIAPLGPTASA